MSGLSTEELKDLLEIASVRAMRARADIATAQKVIADTVSKKDQLNLPRDCTEATATLAQEKWLVWRQEQVAELNRELALARSHLLVVQKVSARAIAQEEVLKSLLDGQVKFERRMAEKRKLETQVTTLTSPAARYQ